MEELIPMVVFLGFYATIVLVVYFTIQGRVRKNKNLHEQKMLAIEKGVDIPIVNEPKEKRHRVHTPFIWPLVFIGIGLALVIGDIADADFDTWSIIPLFIGIGMLLAHHLYYKNKKKKDDEVTELAEKTTTDFNHNY